MLASLTLGGFDMWVSNIFGVNPLGTLRHGKTDAASTGEAAKFKPIDYPKPDGTLSFDRLTNVAFAATNHEEQQPCHLQLADPDVPIKVNLPKFAEPAQRYCPAGVYEVLEGEDAVSANRTVMGATNPAEADAGTIRKEFALSIGENSVHGSDSDENAAIEIRFFFSDIEIVG